MMAMRGYQIVGSTPTQDAFLPVAFPSLVAKKSPVVGGHRWPPEFGGCACIFYLWEKFFRRCPLYACEIELIYGRFDNLPDGLPILHSVVMFNHKIAMCTI